MNPAGPGVSDPRATLGDPHEVGHDGRPHVGYIHRNHAAK